jgi:hypothetical protein
MQEVPFRSAAGAAVDMIVNYPKEKEIKQIECETALCSVLKVRFHHHIFPTNLLTNSLSKSPPKQMSHIFVLFVSQKFVANQIGLLQTY